jgi:hypothetical protein
MCINGTQYSHSDDGIGVEPETLASEAKVLPLGHRLQRYVGLVLCIAVVCVYHFGFLFFSTDCRRPVVFNGKMIRRQATIE